MKYVILKFYRSNRSEKVEMRLKKVCKCKWYNKQLKEQFKTL